MKATKQGIVGAILLAGAALGGPAAGQEFSREGATIGALVSRAGLVVEGEVTSVDRDGAVAELSVGRVVKGDAPAPSLRVRLGIGSAAVELAPGEQAMLLLDGVEDARGALGIEGAFLGAFDLATPEGRALAARAAEYVATAESPAARRAMLAGGLGHWSPRIATDASYDLERTGGELGANEAAAVIDALDRNRATFEDLHALVRLAGRTGRFEAAGPLLDTLQEAGSESLAPEIGEALAHAARGSNVVEVLAAALAGHSDRALRARCAAALGALGDPTAAAPLSQAAGQPDVRVRTAAIRALSSMGEAGVAGLERVLGTRERPETDRKLAAVGLAATRAGVLRLLALEDGAASDMRDWIETVRANPAFAAVLVGR
jgi:hypothetical protein